MGDKKKVNVFEIEYETNEMDWKVKIAGWTKEDAFGYLSKMLGRTNYKIKGFTSITSIDAITTQVTEDIVKANTTESLGKEKTLSKEKMEDKEEDNTTKKSTMKKK